VSGKVVQLPERYLTKEQIASRLEMSTRWVELQVAQGGMPSRLIGGKRRFDWAEVVEWVDRQQPRKRGHG